MKKALMVMSFFVLHFAGTAQVAEEPRGFSRGLLDSLRSMEEYQYGKAPERSSSPVKNQDDYFPGGKQKTGSVMEWLLFLFVSGVLLVIAIVLIRQFSGTAGKHLDRTRPIPVETEEDLARADFHSLAMQAESSNDYRLAFRYQYLWVLQQLQLKNQIVWHPYKTDSDYLQEIPNSRLKASLEPLVKAYTFIWYGQKEISQAQYERLLTSIPSFS